MVLLFRLQLLAPPPRSLAIREELLFRLHSAWHTCHRPVSFPNHHQQHTWHHPSRYVNPSTMPPVLHLAPVAAARLPFTLRASLSSAPRSPIPPADLRLAILPPAALRSFSSAPPRPVLAEGHAAEGRRSRKVEILRAGADGGALAVSGGAEAAGDEVGKGERGGEEVGRGEARGDPPVLAEAAALRQGGDAGADIAAEAEVGRSHGGGTGGGKGGARRRGKRVRLDELCVARWAQYSRSQVRSWILQGALVDPARCARGSCKVRSWILQGALLDPASPIPQSPPSVPSHSPIPQSPPTVPSHSPLSFTTAPSLAPVSRPRLFPTTLPSPPPPLPPPGKVLVEGHPVTKAGAQVSEHADVIIKARVPKYVCRAGYKLEGALQQWGVAVGGAVALDAGLSTGGFADCLLQHGAARVYGVDVGYGQVSERIRVDPRVVVMERTNLRHLSPSDLPEKVDVVTLDLSFISVLLVRPLRSALCSLHSALCTLRSALCALLSSPSATTLVRSSVSILSHAAMNATPGLPPCSVLIPTLLVSILTSPHATMHPPHPLTPMHPHPPHPPAVSHIAWQVMPAVVGVMKPGAHLIVLVKPQFEARRGQVGGGGIEAVRQEVLERVTRGIEEFGMEVQGVMTSPITGTDGNVEFLAHFVRRPVAAPQEVVPPGDSEDLP
ncbi:unnamed protein product [Closterium sp. Naga37s-1]|nr:unnamed protein product [Closterium sp. Naga37s-1]